MHKSNKSQTVQSQYQQQEQEHLQITPGFSNKLDVFVVFCVHKKQEQQGVFVGGVGGDISPEVMLYSLMGFLVVGFSVCRIYLYLCSNSNLILMDLEEGE